MGTGIKKNGLVGMSSFRPGAGDIVLPVVNRFPQQ